MNNLFFHKLVFGFTITILLLFGCNRNGRIERPIASNGSVMVLSPSGEILKLKINERTANLSNYIFPYFSNDGKQFLFLLNASTLELHQFDMDSETHIKTITLASEGPNGVAPISGFYIYSLDSIYIGTMRRAIFLLDTNGIVRQKIYYKNTEIDTYPFTEPFPLIASHVHTPLILRNHKLYLFSIAQGSFTDLKTGNKLAKQRVCFEIDTVAHTGKFLPFTYPENYWSKGIIEPSLSRVYANGEFVYSFFGDHNVYVTADHITHKTYFAGSSLFSDFKYYPDTELSTDEYIRYFSETSGYWSIMYDSFREVFYRFVIIGNEADSGISPEKAITFAPNFSIIVLDKNFNKLGETVFRNNTKYVFTNSFVARDGLYISNNHPDNPENQEDYLSFTLFKLQ
ncbi:MAG: DUF4221 family protein [Sediminibacterium sp.]